MGVNVNFIENNVLELNLKKEFDIIFSSYGTIGWLPDLDQWGKIVAKHLKRGGLFLLTEFHPFIALLDNNQYDYFYKECSLFDFYEKDGALKLSKFMQKAEEKYHIGLKFLYESPGISFKELFNKNMILKIHKLQLLSSYSKEVK